MGLLDFLNTDQINSPEVSGLLKQIAPGKGEKVSAMRKGLLQAGLAIMGAKTGGNLAQAVGQGGMQGMQAYDQSLQEAQQQKMAGMQLERQSIGDAQNTAKFEAWQSGNQTATADAQAMKALGAKYYNPEMGQFDENGYIQELWKLDPESAMKHTEKMKDRSASQAPYFTPFMTSTGAGILNARTGNVNWPSAPAENVPQPPTGVTPPQAGVTTTPAAVPTKPLLPITADPKLKREMSAQDELGKQNVKEIDSSIAAINAAKSELGSLDTLGSAIKDGANTGPIAQWIPSFKSSTLQAEMALKGFSLDNIKKLPGPASDKDVALIRQSGFNEGMDDAYLKKNLPNIRAAAERVIAKNQKYSSLLAGGMDKAQAFKETWGAATEGNSAFTESKREFKVIRKGTQ